MPKRRTDDVVHAVMTDHYIQRRKPARDLLAEIPERHDPDYRGEVVLYYPRTLPKPEDELYLAVAQVSQSSNLSEGIARLSAAIQKYRPQRAEYYLQLGDALRAERQARAVASGLSTGTCSVSRILSQRSRKWLFVCRHWGSISAPGSSSSGLCNLRRKMLLCGTRPA